MTTIFTVVSGLQCSDINDINFKVCFDLRSDACLYVTKVMADLQKEDPDIQWVDFPLEDGTLVFNEHSLTKHPTELKFFRIIPMRLIQRV